MGCFPHLRDMILGLKNRPGLDSPAGCSPLFLGLVRMRHLASESSQADDASAQ